MNRDMKGFVEEKFAIQPRWKLSKLIEEVKQDPRFNNGNGTTELALKQVLGSLKAEGKVAKVFRTTAAGDDLNKEWKRLDGFVVKCTKAENRITCSIELGKGEKRE